MNRKKAVERDCRLWMILAMLVTLLMAVAVPKHIVQAESVKLTCSNKDIPMDATFDENLKGKICTVVFKNETSHRLRMDIEMFVQRTTVIDADPKLKQFLWNDPMVSKRMEGYIIMEPNETANLKFQFRKDYYESTNIKVKPSLATVAGRRLLMKLKKWMQ